ncbi:FtsX-like permease family protein [Colwellia sp. BRX8-7]|jgi:putative ABC transport system permease protein|uniref:FtsX-like permease family protein n=1 Tax=Colwellia sp. BRX8-7 TaxID=2759833 RepID=UPI0015F4950C|nr:FtsX-like permease family protein [Colwellia sp. BRX8-7]MBA6338173.1 FtsX-like permease family protein [Colwellia sp. BRX8-7]
MNFKALLKSLLLRKFTTGLLILQLAITLGLLVNSGILALDTQAKISLPTGLDNENILIVSTHPTSGNYRDLDYFRSIATEDMVKLSQLPGVNSVSVTNQLPIRTGGMRRNVFDLDNPEQDKNDLYLQDVKYILAEENLAKTMGFTILEGRFLNRSDQLDFDSEEKPNIVITASLKRGLYGDESALGQETNNGFIVGVIKDVILDPTLPLDKQYGYFTNAVMKRIYIARYYVLNVEPGQMANVRSKVRDTILGVQAERDIFNIFTMQEHLLAFYRDDQGLADLFLLLCSLMLFVTAISSYAYSQFHISRQQKYIGIRRALGARKKDVLLYVLTENWLVYGMGCLLGVFVAFGFNILLSQHIILSKPDIMLFCLVTCVIFISGTLATWLPAKRTSDIPPVVATRTV